MITTKQIDERIKELQQSYSEKKMAADMVLGALQEMELVKLFIEKENTPTEANSIQPVEVPAEAKE